MEDPHDSPQSSLSDSQLHRILQIFPGVLFSLVQRPDGTCFFAYISEAAEALYELTVAEILADAAHVHQQLHPQDQSAYWQALKNSAVHGRGVCHQWRIITPSGQLKWIRWTSQAEVKENGEIVWDGIIEDITAYQQELETRQQLERELRDLGDRFSLALKSGDIGCWDWNIQENTSFWDQRMYELYGLSGPSPDLPNCEILNHHLHPEDRKATHSLLAQALAGKAEYDTEFRIIRADGEVRFIKAYGTVIRNGKGKALRIIGINFDITHQKLTEQSLRESQQFVQTLLDTLPVYVFWKNRESVFLGCNWPLARLLNLQDPQEIVGKTDFDLSSIEEQAIAYRLGDQRVIESGQAELNVEENHLLENGELQWIETHKAPLRDANQTVMGVVGVFQDITDRKNYEFQLQQKNQELQSLLQLREEALTIREDMSNMIVHDLRNPLSSILLSVNVLNHYLNSPSTNLGMNPSILKRKLQQISVAGQRLEKMIDSLLVMAKLESGKLLFNPVSTDLYQLGQMIHRDFELMANAYQVKFHVQLPAPERTILIDETILRRVIDNLLTNAFKFSPKEGLIQLTLEYLPERQCRIQVADQGPGINKDQEQEIFKKFEIGTVKKNVAQIGLGLAFCKMAVEAQGGSLLLAPNEPQGSIFTVII
ncbi:MAG: PAS domain-containing protein [Microcystaceae cyanobacterium]